MDPLTQQLIELLGLTPAEGADAVTPEQVIAKVTELLASGNQVAEVQGTLAATQAELEKIRAEHQALYEREEAARKAAAEAEAAAILAQYEIGSPETTATLHALLLSDRESAMKILSSWPVAKQPASPVEPPAPMHTPEALAPDSADPAAQAAKIKTRAQDLQKANPAMPWSEAWAKAEAEIRAAA
jgi:hypothetical protein